MTDTATLLMMPDGDTPEAADFAAGDVFKTFELRSGRHINASPRANLWFPGSGLAALS